MTQQQITNNNIKKELSKGNYMGSKNKWYQSIAEIFGVHAERVRKHHRQMLKATVNQMSASTKTVKNASTESKVTYSSESIAGTKTVTTRPKSEDEIFIAFDIDRSKWKIEKYEVKSWDGFIKNKNEEIETKELFSVYASFKPLSIKSDIGVQKNAILDEIRQHAPSFDMLIPASTMQTIEGDNAYLIAIPDLHIGKLAHKDETGEDYDIKIAEKRFNDAVDALLSRVNMGTVSRIVLPIGNDLMNVDNANKTTTAGTPQDTDTRYFKMFQSTIRIITNAINKLVVYAPVDVIIIPGNHDETSMLNFGLVLDAYYNNTDQVTVDCSPMLRKYYRFGKVGIQFTHGDKEPHTSLGLIFATEQPKLWAKTKYRFCMLGHMHKNKKMNYVSVDEHQGFQVQIIPSLSASDKWHFSKGYMSLKQAKSFLYNKNEGLIGEFTYTV